jgi:hypothetical protein
MNFHRGFDASALSGRHTRDDRLYKQVAGIQRHCAVPWSNNLKTPSNAALRPAATTG